MILTDFVKIMWLFSFVEIFQILRNSVLHVIHSSKLNLCHGIQTHDTLLLNFVSYMPVVFEVSFLHKKLIKGEWITKLKEYLPSMKLDVYSFELHQECVDKYHTQHLYLPTLALFHATCNYCQLTLFKVW